MVTRTGPAAIGKGAGGLRRQGQRAAGALGGKRHTRDESGQDFAVHIKSDTVTLNLVPANLGRR